MNMILDANAILRFLLNDIPDQADIVADAIQTEASTIPEVIAEVVYVLSGVYHVDRSTISSTLQDLFNEIYIADKPVITEALRLYAATGLDYVDCVLIARSKILGNSILSFDKKLNAELNKQQADV